MSRVGVCLDGGECSEWAFHLALQRLNKKDDELYLLYVAKTSGLEQTIGVAFIDLWRQMLEEDLAHGKRVLRARGREARAAGVTHIHPMLLTGSDIGNRISEFATEKQLNMVFLGKRSNPSTLSSLIAGSVSKQVMESSECSVTTVSSRFGPEELHSCAEAVVAAEEEERRRRMSVHLDEAKKAVLQKITALIAPIHLDEDDDEGIVVE